jgi:hypothetical protein
MDFKPTILKTIISLLVAIIVNYLLTTTFLGCMGDKCPTILQKMMATNGIIGGLVFFIIIYLIWSLIQKKKQ